MTILSRCSGVQAVAGREINQRAWACRQHLWMITSLACFRATSSLATMAPQVTPWWAALSGCRATKEWGNQELHPSAIHSTWWTQLACFKWIAGPTWASRAATQISSLLTCNTEGPTSKYRHLCAMVAAVYSKTVGLLVASEQASFQASVAAVHSSEERHELQNQQARCLK